MSCLRVLAAIGPCPWRWFLAVPLARRKVSASKLSWIVNFECRFLCYITGKCTSSACSWVSSSVVVFGGNKTHWDRDSWGDLATDATPRCEINTGATATPQRRNATAQPAQRRRHGAKGDSKCFQSCDLGTDSSCSGKTWDGWVITLNIFNRLVVWNIGFSFFHLLGISSSQLTNSYFYIFFRGVGQPPTSILYTWICLP